MEEGGKESKTGTDQWTLTVNNYMTNMEGGKKERKRFP
jgi:hypothetical protein